MDLLLPYASLQWSSTGNSRFLTTQQSRNERWGTWGAGGTWWGVHGGGQVLGKVKGSPRIKCRKSADFPRKWRQYLLLTDENISICVDVTWASDLNIPWSILIETYRRTMYNVQVENVEEYWGKCTLFKSLSAPFNGFYKWFDRSGVENLSRTY